MKRVILPLIFFMCMGAVVAQKKELTLEDAILNKYYHLAPDDIWQLHWVPEKEQYAFVDDNGLTSVDIKNEKHDIIDLNRVNSILAAADQPVVGGFPTVEWLDSERIYFENNRFQNVLNVATHKLECVIEIDEKAQNIDFDWNSKSVAYTIDNNLWVSNSEKAMPVSSEPNGDIVFGRSVHRREFGIDGGIFWSPKGNLLAFYRKDESMVADYPLVDYSVTPAVYTPIKYPMAGAKSHHVTVGVYNPSTNSTVYLESRGSADHYLTNVAWTPDEQFILIQELNRGQNHMMMNKYDAKTGAFVATLFEERNERYVEPQHPVWFSETNVNHFYYWARTDGFYHIYKYDISGKLIKQLTKGEWEVTDFIGFAKNERYMFVQATKVHALCRDIYRVDTRNGKMIRIAEQEGTNSAQLSSDGKYLINKYVAKEVPNKIDLYTASGKHVRNLLTSKDNAAEYQFGENRLVTIPSTDGTTELYGRLILPPNFDASKKYPVIVYVYGGPHSQLVRNTWHNSARWWQYYMAQKGYIAFTLDNRGTNNRGRAFESVIHRQLGVKESEDQMAGVNYLKSLPYVDQARMGVHGWSFGGFMTLNLMMRHADVFKVGVAGGPVVDWSMYEVMYGERYMDTPQENKAGYEMSNMTNWIPKLNGKLLMIHGVQDPTVVMQHNMRFIRSCIEQQKQVDFFCYPTHKHNVRGTDRIHLMEKVSRYFIDNL